MRLAARRRALIRAERRVALHEPDTADRHAQLFGDQLSLRRLHALAELDLPRIRGDLAVRADGDPRVELSAGRTLPLATLRAQHPTACAEAAESHDERPGGFQEIAPREAGGAKRGACVIAEGAIAAVGAHRAPPSRYFAIARIIRVCTKQRHRTPDIACRISASVAFGF